MISFLRLLHDFFKHVRIHCWILRSITISCLRFVALHRLSFGVLFLWYSSNTSPLSRIVWKFFFFRFLLGILLLVGNYVRFLYCVFRVLITWKLYVTLSKLTIFFLYRVSMYFSFCYSLSQSYVVLLYVFLSLIRTCGTCFRLLTPLISWTFQQSKCILRYWCNCSFSYTFSMWYFELF